MGVEKFDGVLDGDGHEIKNLFINRPRDPYVGLFGLIDSAWIYNVGLVDCRITGRWDVGGLVGKNSGEIVDCHVTGNIKGIENAGGITGDNYRRFDPSQNRV